MAEKSTKYRIPIAILITIVFGVLAAISAGVSLSHWGLDTGRGVADRIAILGMAAFGYSVFGLGLLRYEKGSVLDQDEIRSAIAISLTVVYIILLPLSLVPNIGLNFDGEFLKNFHYAYVTVIAFYFGTNALEIYKKNTTKAPPKSQTI